MIYQLIIISNNTIKEAPTFEMEFLVYNYAEFVLMMEPEAIIMLLELETGECAHCDERIQEKPGWILYKWIHIRTRAHMCFGQDVTRAEPK